MHRIDLHTHSVGSPDGSLSVEQYRKMLESKRLATIAITDHDRIDFAQMAQKELGEAIIVGQEVTTMQGEIIGLYLREIVPAGLSVRAAVAAIRAQHGLVYIPHPFETIRHGIASAVLDDVASDVDIIEGYNGRAWFQDKGAVARAWGEAHRTAEAASSDAHGWLGWGRTYSIVAERPTRETLVRLLSEAHYSHKKVSLAGILYPKLNRMRGGTL